MRLNFPPKSPTGLAQSEERPAFNRVVVGSIPTVGVGIGLLHISVLSTGFSKVVIMKRLQVTIVYSPSKKH